MAQDRLSSLIGKCRRLVGDEYNRTTAAIIADPLTEDGNAWTAQAMADAAEITCNEIVATGYVSLGSDGDRLARMFGEMVFTKDLDLTVPQQPSGNKMDPLLYYTLPSDFGYLVSARFRHTKSGRIQVVDFSDSIRHVHLASTESSPEEQSDPKGFIIRKTLAFHYHVPGVNLRTSDSAMQLTYVALQPELKIGSQNDVLLLPRWDMQILAGMKKHLEEFKK